jgi:hypothetical protein
MQTAPPTIKDITMNSSPPVKCLLLIICANIATKRTLPARREEKDFSESFVSYETAAV